MTGTGFETRVSEGVYELTRIRDVPRPSGATRVATPEDRPLLLEWNRAFLLEALPEPEKELGHVEEIVDRLFSSDEVGTWLWELEGMPVSLAGFSGRTTTGTRVGPVYTPPEHRRRGYASALVADLSSFLLAEGNRACFLYTDLANPTSNSIYTKIGYERVCDAAMIHFLDP
jgi:predicted GNAT family acetyltransferase